MEACHFRPKNSYHLTHLARATCQNLKSKLFKQIHERKQKQKSCLSVTLQTKSAGTKTLRAAKSRWTINKDDKNSIPVAISFKIRIFEPLRSSLKPVCFCRYDKSEPFSHNCTIIIFEAPLVQTPINDNTFGWLNGAINAASRKNALISRFDGDCFNVLMATEYSGIPVLCSR